MLNLHTAYFDESGRFVGVKKVPGANHKRISADLPAL
jgi:hypothetical protein